MSTRRVSGYGVKRRARNKNLTKPLILLPMR